MEAIMLITDKLSELSSMEETLSSSYRIIPETNAGRAVDRLKKLTLPTMIVLDAEISAVNLFETLGRLQSDKKLREIPVLALCSTVDHSTELEAYRYGVCDFLIKPVPPELLKRKVDFHIEAILRKKELAEKDERLKGLSDNIKSASSLEAETTYRIEYFLVGVLGDLITHKDGYTGLHCKRVALLLNLLLRQMMADGTAAIPPQDLDLILMSAQLFDMGKIGIPDQILSKTEKYTDAEFEIMKRHTVIAADSIQRFAYLVPNNSFTAYAYQMARSHHEQWCGKGYPDGLAGAQIPFLARLVAVCDTYDALMTKRSYKQELSHEQACLIIRQTAGVHFDPQVVDAFAKVHSQFYQTILAEREKENASPKPERTAKKTGKNSGMSFELWLFAVKKLAQTQDAALLIYENFPEEEKEQLKKEFKNS